MRTALHALLVCGGLLSLSGCVLVQAHTPAAVPLAVPDPPSRVVMPPATPPEPVVEDPPPAPAPAAATTTSPPNPKPPTPPPASKPPDRPPVSTAPPPEPPPVLQTTAETGELQKRIQRQIDDANRDLGKVARSALGPDALAQYDWARSFLRQALAALAIRNYNLADVCSDRAARVASLLVKRFVTSATSS